MILVDTSVWVDYFRRGESPEAICLQAVILDDAELSINGLILTEVLQGIGSDRECAEAERELSGLTYLLMTRESHVLAADIYRRARRKGKTVRSPADCMIAACAIAHQATLLQRDRDFAAIAEVSDLKLAIV